MAILKEPSIGVHLSTHIAISNCVFKLWVFRDEGLAHAVIFSRCGVLCVGQHTIGNNFSYFNSLGPR